jgi:indolepyruvate ferredoxin oxidoreductase beta subunit
MMATKASFDIFMIGVGGQGIGLLAEALARAADHAGIVVRGCDTHGLAQRGGVVTSHLRLGASAHSPLVSQRCADLVIALERHEALRGARTYLKSGGVLVWYDTSLQPLGVRLGEAAAVSREDVEEECRALGALCQAVERKDLGDSRAQNVAVMAHIAAAGLVPGIDAGHFKAALGDLMAGAALERNLALFG